MKKAVVRYEGIVGAKINFEKSEVLRLGGYKGGIPQTEPFRSSDRPVRILGVSNMARIVI